MSLSVSLLDLLDDAVRKDTRPAGFSASICLGIHHQYWVRWWWARCQPPRTECHFANQRLENANVTLLLGAEDAESFLRSSDLTAPRLARIEGDRRVLERFVRRYLVRMSILDSRVSMSVQSVRRRRR